MPEMARVTSPGYGVKPITIEEGGNKMNLAAMFEKTPLLRRPWQAWGRFPGPS